KRLMSMRGKSWMAAGLAGLLALPAVPQAVSPEVAADQPPQIIGRSLVTDVIVPVTVHDRDGNIVNGLQPRNFHLDDNDKEQEIAVDVSFHPISLVLAVQSNASVEAILPQVRKVGSLLEAFVVGDQGEAAVLAFDHRFQVKQEFTNELPKITEALKK